MMVSYARRGRAAQTLLGRSELRITSDLYAHLQAQTAAKTARHMDRLLNREEAAEETALKRARRATACRACATRDRARRRRSCP